MHHYNKPIPSTPMEYLVYFLEEAISIAQEGNVKAAISSIQNALYLAKDLGPYLENYSFIKNTNDDNINALAEKTQNTNWNALFENGKTYKRLSAGMLTGAYEGAFLKMLARLIKARRILEIGMFTGYSTLTLASILPEEGVIITCEEEPYLVEFAQTFFNASNHSHQIQIRKGPALETLKALARENQTFDIIFIDANKGEYIEYYRTIKNGNLLERQGVLCVDNTLMKGLVYSSIAKKNSLARSIIKFNQFVKQDPEVEQIILPIRDGLSIIRKV